MRGISLFNWFCTCSIGSIHLTNRKLTIRQTIAFFYISPRLFAALPVMRFPWFCCTTGKEIVRKKLKINNRYRPRRPPSIRRLCNDSVSAEVAPAAVPRRIPPLLAAVPRRCGKQVERQEVHHLAMHHPAG